MTQPILIVEDEVPQRKRKNAIVEKAEVYRDIENQTYKHVDGPVATTVPDPRQRDAVQADTTEHLDGDLITRYLSFRDAQLRTFLRAFLTEEDLSEDTDVMAAQRTAFVYALDVPVEFRDNTLDALTEYLHRYLVSGTLLDWYARLGMTQQASVYAQELEDLKADILALVNARSYAKRPLQPFGPAKMPV